MYVMLTVMVGFDGSGNSRNRRPLGRLYSVMPSTLGPLMARHGISTEIAVHRDMAGNSMNIRELQPNGFTPALDWLAGRYMA